MEHHAELGHRLLQGSSVEVLKQAATIAWTHHEHFDGNGYPRGLAGEEIPLIGRIACVADVFDALTTDRVYRSAMSTEDATALLIAQRGHHFDPRVVDAFLAVADEVNAIFVRFAEKPPEGEEPADVPAPLPLVTLQHAASTLGISPARLRRWSDEGRIEAVRTPGGHRRFALEAVRLLAAERGSRPVVRPLEPAVGEAAAAGAAAYESTAPSSPQRPRRASTAAGPPDGSPGKTRPRRGPNGSVRSLAAVTAATTAARCTRRASSCAGGNCRQ